MRGKIIFKQQSSVIFLYPENNSDVLSELPMWVVTRNYQQYTDRWTVVQTGGQLYRQVTSLCLPGRWLTFLSFYLDLRCAWYNSDYLNLSVISTVRTKSLQSGQCDYVTVWRVLIAAVLRNLEVCQVCHHNQPPQSQLGLVIDWRKSLI